MKKYDLNGKWSFHEVGRGKWFDAEVPGCNYKDLVNLNEIIHPFKDLNNDKVQWVGERNWEYVKEFNLTSEFLISPRLVLVCKGLDTLADIYINDKLIAKVENAHRSYEFNIKNFVSRLTNKVRIKFRSPIRQIESSQDTKSLCTPKEYFPGCTYLRKPSIHFGSQQNPPLPLCGIVGDIYIMSYDEIRFSEINIIQNRSADYFVLTSKISIDSQLSLDNKDTEICAKIKITEPDGTESATNLLIVDKESESFNVINNPKLWYTHDVNDDDNQPLYTVVYELFMNNKLVDRSVKVIGLRTLELNREKDEFGKKFQLILNSTPIYIKGGVLLNNDLLLDNKMMPSPQQLAERLTNANINLVRIPAEGTYLSDDYLTEFDKKGILVWQDLPFVGGEFTLDKKDFVKNVTAEISSAVSRMSSHPSLALVCGNYGVEIGFTKLKINTGYRKVYTEFFYNTVKEIIGKINPYLLYIPTAPLSTAPFEKTNSAKDGVSHLWNIWAGMESVDSYKKIVPRFCVEFGLASMCDYSTMRDFSGDKAIELNSEFMDSRITSNNALSKIVYYMSFSFKVPKDIEPFIYVSQLVQADYYKKMILFQRANKGKSNGVIFSSINSMYPGVNMSCIDFNGNHKPSMYKLADSFSPIAIYAEISKGKIKNTFINDYNSDLKGKLHWFIESYDGENLDAGEQNFSMRGASALKLPSLEVKENIKKDLSDKLFVMEIFDDSDNLVCREILPLARNNKLAKLKLPELNLSVHMVRNFAFVTVSSNTYARYVKLNLEGNKNPFSDNYFDILAGEEITVSILTGKAKAEDILSKLTVTSVAESEIRTSNIGLLFKNFATVVSVKTLKTYLIHKFLK